MKPSEELFLESRNGYDRLTESDEQAMLSYCEGYKAFLNVAKTERECVREAIRLAEAQGFQEWIPGKRLSVGAKVYYNNRGKTLMLAMIGKKPLSEGMTISAAHVDCPHLDLKPTPLYEEADIGYFKTHYYGGVVKYHWLNIPLELHGIIVRRDGTTTDVRFGTELNEPKLVITDLLPHLGKERAKKPLAEVITAEKLNIIVGSRPVKDDQGGKRVKLAIMRFLHQKYGIVEEDLITAELHAVPAFLASDIGFDGSLIGAFGQDDRVCAYAALRAFLDADAGERTAMCLLVDREEIGDVGVSGMLSQSFEWFVGDLCGQQSVHLRTCFAKSQCLAVDVSAAFDPNYSEAYDKHCKHQLNHGISLVKYTGPRGKSGASEASCELVAQIRNLLNRNGILWQTGEMGRVDLGGGGTNAKFLANRNIDVLDAGVPVLGMHTPFEVTAKLDCYMTYRGIRVFFEA